MRQDEHLLIEQIISGDKEAFRIIIKNYKRLVFHIIFRMVSNKTEREEIGQEIFIKIYDSLPKFKGKSSLATWISVIARNTCKNFIKKKKVALYEDVVSKDREDMNDNNSFDKVLTDEEPYDVTMSKNEIYEILNKEIILLPELYKEIISLYYLGQLSYKEISVIVKLPEGTIKSYMSRARTILKEKLITKYQLEEI
ncbi:RNA polymerase sigma factor [Bacteroidota bacterium]